MPFYVEYAELAGLIPPAFLTQALDDDGDGVVDAWALVQSQACDAVDALLCGRYAVPFPTPFPVIVRAAARAFAASQCYVRRGRIEDQNPFAEEAGRLRAQLQQIAKGNIPLTPDTQPVVTEEPAAVIGAARSSSRSGRTPV